MALQPAAAPDTRRILESLLMSSGLPSACPETLQPRSMDIHEQPMSAQDCLCSDSLATLSDDLKCAVKAAPAPQLSTYTLTMAQVADQVIDSHHEYEGESEISSDNDSTCEMQCFQARIVRFLHPGRPSIIDVMRAEKPAFKLASQVVVRRPLSRPKLSSIQSRRSSSEPHPDFTSSCTSYSSIDSHSQASTPPTPTFEDDQASSTTEYTTPPSSPVTPRSSFDQERRLFVAYKSTSPGPASSPNSVAEPELKTRKPSRLRLFARKTFPTNAGEAKAVPYSQAIGAESVATLDRCDTATPRPWVAQSGPNSPATSEPLTAKFAPVRTMWREKLGMARA